MRDRMAIRGRGRLALVAMPAVLALALSSCAYYKGAVEARDAGGSVPWWCTSTEEHPGHCGVRRWATVYWYMNIDKAPLALGTTAWRCRIQFNAARTLVGLFPTRGQGRG